MIATGAVLLTLLAFLGYHLHRAPEGHQDDEGYHDGPERKP